MKKLLMIMVALIVGSVAYSQSNTLLDTQPVQVVFSNNGQVVTLSDAKEIGVEIDKSLVDVRSVNLSQNIMQPISLNILFNSNILSKNVQSIDFEVKWFYYMSSRRMLMQTKTITLGPDNVADSDNMLKLECLSCKQMRAGIWEVQVKNKLTNKLVSWANQDSYKIVVK